MNRRVRSLSLLSLSKKKRSSSYRTGFSRPYRNRHGSSSMMSPRGILSSTLLLDLSSLKRLDGLSNLQMGTPDKISSDNHHTDLDANQGEAVEWSHSESESPPRSAWFYLLSKSPWVYGRANVASSAPKSHDIVLTMLKIRQLVRMNARAYSKRRADRTQKLTIRVGRRRLVLDSFGLVATLVSLGSGTQGAAIRTAGRAL